MKIIVLTTDTLHHTYFVKRLTKKFPLTGVIAETKILKPEFDTHHPFEDRRNIYEQDVFFNGGRVSLSEAVDTFFVDSVNGPESVSYIKKILPDIIIVFGTGIISKDVIECCPEGIVNLHGGNPEEYRGLDTHLWAIYHKDFENLIVTFHMLNKELDDGDIILQKKIGICNGMLIYELRRFTTEICVELVLSALSMYSEKGYFLSRVQEKKGRYYSFMPAPLKEICVANFKKYAESIDEVCREAV